MPRRKPVTKEEREQWRARDRVTSKRWYDTKGKAVRAARHKATYPLKKAEIVAANNAYAKGHRAKINAARRQQYALHPDTQKTYVLQRRARSRNAGVHDFTAGQWKDMQQAYHHRCVYCGKQYKGKLTQDHLTPLSKGGTHTKSNIVPACRSCNSKKGTRKVLKPVQPLLL